MITADLFPVDERMSRIKRHAAVDETAADAIAEIRAMATQAIKEINYSVGQSARRARERCERAAKEIGCG